MSKADGWVELDDGVHALLGAVNCAVLETPTGGAVIVDSGADKDHGKRVRRRLEALGRAPVALICSHSHADHIGGNAYLQGVYSELRTYAPTIEAELIRSPYLESVYLFGGAKPLAELTGKWLMAPPSRVDVVVEPRPLVVDGLELELVDVRGHAHRQLAVGVKSVLLAADSLFGEATLGRYPLPFAQDVAGQLAAIDVAGSAPSATLLPGHGEPTSDAGALAELNRQAVERAAHAVLAACDGVGAEAVLAGVCEELGIVIADLPRYHLNLCTVLAHLGRLRSTGQVEATLRAGALVWSRA